MMDIFTALLESATWGLALKLLLLIVVITASGIVANKLLGWSVRHLKKTRTSWDHAFAESIRRPVTLLIWVVGLTYGVEFIWPDLSPGVHDFIVSLRKLSVIVCAVLFVLRFLHQTERILVDHKKFQDRNLDEVGLRAINKALRATAIITAVLMGFSTMGYSIAGILAFGGIGGLVVGFAAKDLLSNFFGGLIIYLDRPFTEGNWIRSPDRDIEGVVEHIGWRLTRIRTFEQRPIYVPNSVFAQIVVENPSRMEYRRIRESVGVRYTDLSKIPAIVSDTQKMLQEHDQVASDKLLIVSLDKFADSSVNILIYIHVKTTDAEHFYALKQELFLAIAGIVEQHGAEIAFPTRTLHLTQDWPEQN